MYRYILAILTIFRIYAMNCKNCIYFKPAPSSLRLHTEYAYKWNKCTKFNDYTDYCRKEEGLCGPEAKCFINKDSFVDVYTTYIDLLVKINNEKREVNGDQEKNGEE